MKLTPKRRELIAAVRAHANKNYCRGWDVIVECYDDEAILKVIGQARTVKGALAKFAPIIDVLADRQAEAAHQIREAVGSDDPYAWRVEDFEAGDLIQVIKNGPKIYVTGATADVVTVDDVNGAPRSYPAWRIVTRQRGGRKGETLTSRPASAIEHYRTGGEFSYDRPGCGCGQAFATDKAADLHVVAAHRADGTYDRTSQGHHPDGSFVHWRHDEHSGEGWGTRTWEGKVGQGYIEIVETDAGYQVEESYSPGWGGLLINSPGYCDYDPNVPF